jgi:hypothetical protein
LMVDFRFLLIEWVLGAKLPTKGSPRGAPSTPKVSFWSVERIGRSISWSFEFFPRAVFLPTAQAKTGLTGFSTWAVEKGFWARESMLHYGFFCSDVERVLRCFGSHWSFWGVSEQSRSDWFAKLVWPLSPACVRLSPTEAVWLVSETGLTGFRNRPDRFGLTAAGSCVFPLCVSCGCWLGLAPRFSSTSVAAWIWQEKLGDVHEWNRVHRPNSWIGFLLAPIHSPLLWFAVSVLHKVPVCDIAALTAFLQTDSSRLAG